MNAEFIVFAEPPISSQPCEAALDDPGQPNDLERSLLPFDDPEFVAVTPPQLLRELSALVAGVSDDGPNFVEREAQAAEQSMSGFAVRNIRRLNAAGDREPKCTNEDMASRAGNLTPARS